jgi:hypothetical protein
MLLRPYDEGVFYGTQAIDDIRIVSPQNEVRRAGSRAWPNRRLSYDPEGETGALRYDSRRGEIYRPGIFTLGTNFCI